MTMTLDEVIAAAGNPLTAARPTPLPALLHAMPAIAGNLAAPVFAPHPTNTGVPHDGSAVVAVAQHYDPKAPVAPAVFSNAVAGAAQAPTTLAR